jgi:hypothetical protein
LVCTAYPCILLQPCTFSPIVLVCNGSYSVSYTYLYTNATTRCLLMPRRGRGAAFIARPSLLSSERSAILSCIWEIICTPFCTSAVSIRLWFGKCKDRASYIRRRSVRIAKKLAVASGTLTKKE